MKYSQVIAPYYGGDELDTDLPDPPENPTWLTLLTDQERDLYALRFERGIGRNQSALYHIERKRIARDRAREADYRSRGYKFGDVVRVRP